MDPRPVRIDELLAHAPWVRALAGRLVRDPATADDVAQEVWASALRRPPQERSNLRGWLAVAVRNAALSLRRGEQRREAREQAAPARSEPLGPAELVERAELHRELVEHVLALEEPQRSMVLAHWFEGLAVAEAGRRLGLSERVARLRLDAAHEALLKRLDRRPGGRGAWSAAFLEWTRPQLAAAGTGGTLALGGIAVATKFVVFGAAAAVLTAVAWISWPRDPVAMDQAASLVQVESGMPTPAPASVVAVPAGVDARAVIAKAPMSGNAQPVPEAKPRWFVRGHVHGGPEGTLAGTLVSAAFVGSLAVPGPPPVEAGADGSFEIELTETLARWQDRQPTDLVVEALHPLTLRSESRVELESAVREERGDLVPAQVLACDLALTLAAVVTGRVLAPSVPAPELVKIQVGLYEAPLESVPGRRGIDHAYCDADGRFALRVNRSGEFVVIAVANRQKPEHRVANLVLGRSTEVGVIVLEHAHSIAGTVLRDGQPIAAGARVSAELTGRSVTRIEWSAWSSYGRLDLETCESALRQRSASATTDQAGRFRLEGLDEADYDLRVDSIPGALCQLGDYARVERVVRAPADGIVLTELPPMLHLRFTVDGRPAEPGELDHLGLELIDLSADGRRTPLGRSPWPSDYGIIPRARVDYTLRVAAGRFEELRLAVPALAPNGVREILANLRTRTATSKLVVRLLSDPPIEPSVAEFCLIAVPDGAVPDWLPVERAKDGRFHLTHLAAGHQRLRVRFPSEDLVLGNLPFLPTEMAVELTEGRTLECDVVRELGSRLRVSVKDERGGFMRAAVELRDATGERIDTQFVSVTRSGSVVWGGFIGEQGINDHPPLPAGHYDLTLTADGFEPARVPFDLIRGETVTLEVPMRRS